MRIIDFCTSGLIAFGTGIVILSLYPTAIIPAIIFVGGGLCGIVKYFDSISEFDTIFRNLKLGFNESYPIKKRIVKKDKYKLYEFTLPAGLSIEHFKSKQLEFESYVGKPIEFEYIHKNLIIKVFEPEKTKYQFESIKVKSNAEIIIGYNKLNKIITVDLSRGEPHMLIGGETNSGKSTYLRCAITNAILNNNVEIYLIDLKNGVEFNIFKNCNKVIGFASNVIDAKQLLQKVEKEVDNRYDLFYKNNVKDIKAYHNKINKNMKYQLVIIDEFADLSYDKDNSTVETLERLASKSRACGVHLILATQRPDSKVLSGRIKTNVSNVLGLKTLNRINSNIIGINGLENLRGFGHGIFKRGFIETYIQCPNIEPDEAEKLIAPFNRVKPNQQNTIESNIEIKSFDFLDADWM